LGSASGSASDSLRIVFAGTPPFAATHLQAMLDHTGSVVGVITQPDKAGKRGRTPIPSAVKQLAVERNIPVFQPHPIDRATLRGLEADLLVVVAYGQILKPEVLTTPTHGCINVHASLLPRWRGAAPVQRAILAGEVETGVCIMQMDAGLDTGPVLRRVVVPVSSLDTAATLAEKLAHAGSAALLQTLADFTAGNVRPSPQPPTGATYARKVEKAEARIDWADTATGIERLVRAFNPDPIAHTSISGMRVRVWASSCVEGTGAPGEILALSKHGLTVACGEGALLLTRVQLDRGKGSVLGGADLLNGRHREISLHNRFD
jgi:methionyl-tRNA formyltransferase